MVAAPILHVGDDVCYRIPVMERAGLVVCHAPCSVDGVRSAFLSNERFSALAFQLAGAPIAETVLTAARCFSTPLILFEDSGIAFDPNLFDLVIPNQTRPETWLRMLGQIIQDSRQLHAYSRQLREDTANVRSDFRALHAQLHRQLVSPIDLDKIWRGHSDESAPVNPKRKPEDEE